MRKIILATSIILIAAGCNHQQSVQQTGPASQNPVANALVSDSIQIGGFEGDYSRIDYALQYSIDDFKAVKNSQGVVLASLKNSNVNTVKFGYNGALGAQSSQEYWDALKLCADCKLAPNDIAIADAIDQKTYTNSNDEWVIYKVGPDFAVLNLKQPNDFARQTLATLKASSTKESQTK